MTAPIAIALDAVSCPIDAVLIARVRVVEQAVTRPACARLRRDIADGLRWTYGHAPLAPLAVSTHLRFLANAAALTVFATLALRALALPAAQTPGSHAIYVSQPKAVADVIRDAVAASAE
ncbi:hypothetical protein [Clavibacter zhangzhiyongii]|uniref:hypothetical protein n=1 Tax=Clavibacter TaxID=1573 RepID=UPI0039E15B0F